MITYRDFIRAFRELGLTSESKVIVHASLSAFGEVAGGADAVVGALLASLHTVIMPTFTTRTMVVPPMGPGNNAMDYGSAEDRNRMAEFFRLDMPADGILGVIAETLRRHPQARRSSHPLLSFAGVNAGEGLGEQTLEDPFGPIVWLAASDGDVLLLGVDHTANTSIHYAERLAGRKQFVRWALTPGGVVTCPGWPGCPDGFETIRPRLSGISRRMELDEAWVEMVPLRDLIHVTTGWIRENPLALLCDRSGCERCDAVRASARVSP